MAGLEHPEMLALLALALPALYVLVRRHGRFTKLVGFSRGLIILLLVVAAATPYINAQTSIMKQPEVVVLKDESVSAELMDDVELDFEEVKVKERVIASGNSSELKDGILRNMDRNKAYLVVSDFQSTDGLKGVAATARRKNSTINALKPGIEDETSVSIEGPETTVPGAENRYTVKVHSTETPQEPSVTVDGEQANLEVVDSNTWRLTETFDSEGSHTIKASIGSNDRYGINNEYFHAVEVTEKPEVLVVGPRGALGDKLDKFYDITYNQRIPDDLSDYYSVILTEDKKDQSLVPYVTEGNGLVYTGDPSKSSTDVLPVKKVSRDEQTDAAKILLAIDISFAKGECAQEGVICFEDQDAPEITRSKAIAFNLVEEMPYNTKVGILPYNDEVYYDDQATDPVPLARNREMLKNKIERLQPSGNSLHHKGLDAGKDVLNGTGNIILISDGQITQYGKNVNTDGRSRRIASNLDVKLVTVGVGQNRNKGFLRDIANRGNGHYLDAEDSDRLRFQFAAGGSEGQLSPLTVVNPNHFITEDIELNSNVKEFDTVEPKTGANLLAASTNGDPALSSWRYGLGRVAAFSADDKQVSNIIQRDPLLVTRTVSWSVGDPKRKQDKWIRADSARQPEEVELKASYDVDGFQRQSEDLYTREVKPEGTGFNSVNELVYSYNYPEEMERVGYNDNMDKIVESTGGEVYTPDQMNEIKENIRRFSDKKTTTKKPVANYFLLAALILFLGEVGYRKVKGKK